MCYNRSVIENYGAKTHMKKDMKTEESLAGDSFVFYGRNSVMELLRSGRDIDKIYVKNGELEGSAVVIAAEAKSRGIPVVAVGKEKLDYLSGSGNHQGVVAMAAGVEYVGVDDILHEASERGEPPFIVICDGVEDPHNLGAVIRCAEGCGVHGVIISKRHSAPMSAAVLKSSAGALAHIKVAKVANIASAIDELKKKGVWIYGAEADGKQLYETDMSGACAVVVGSEGAGMSRLVREKCDFVVSIPMYGKVNSFNVSCASAVILCHAARARH